MKRIDAIIRPEIELERFSDIPSFSMALESPVPHPEKASR